MSVALKVTEPRTRSSIQVDGNAFLATLRKFSTQVHRRNTIPILSYVLLKVTSVGRLSISATDMESETIASMACTGDGDFFATLPYRELMRTLAIGVSDATQICYDEAGRISIAGGPFKAIFPTLPAEDFPTSKWTAPTTSFNLNRDALLAVLLRVSSAISHDATRYYLNGIFFKPTADGLTFVATDGHRMVIDKIITDLPADVPEVIVPKDLVRTLIRHLRAHHDDVTIQFGPGKGSSSLGRLVLGDITIVFKTIDSHFPEYERVIPEFKDAVTTIVFDSKSVRTTVRNMANITGHRSQPIALCLGPEMVINLVSPDGASVSIDTPYVCDGQQPRRIGMQARYMAPMLDRVSGDVTMHLLDETSPMTFTAADAPDWLGIIMPMRL